MSSTEPSENPQFWLKEVTINLNVITLLAVHGNLLLALRHPENLGQTRAIVLNFAKQIGEQLVILGAITPEQLEEAYEVESEAGTPELLDPFIFQIGNKSTKQVIMSDMAYEDLFSMLVRDAKCCACGNPMRLSPNLNFVSLNKYAAWKYPIWDNMLLKPVYPRIPRAIAVLCEKCIRNNKLALEVIEVEGKEIRYHNVADLEDAFEITPDMLITNEKDGSG